MRSFFLRICWGGPGDCFFSVSVLVQTWPDTTALEKIGYRTDIFTLDGITGSQREYIRWLLKTSTGKGKPEDILTTEAVDLLAMKLRTPLQVQLHLTLAMEAGYQTGEKPITATLVESVLSRQLDDLEPTLTRHGYGV